MVNFVVLNVELGILKFVCYFELCKVLRCYLIESEILKLIGSIMLFWWYVWVDLSVFRLLCMALKLDQIWHNLGQIYLIGLCCLTRNGSRSRFLLNLLYLSCEDSDKMETYILYKLKTPQHSFNTILTQYEISRF